MEATRRRIIWQPKYGVYFDGVNEVMDTTLLKALDPVKVVGIRHNSGSDDRIMTVQNVSDLIHHSCDANGWDVRDSILWMIRQGKTRVQNEWDEIAIAYAAGCRIFELGNEVFNNFLIQTPWSYRQYRDWCLSLIERIPADATIITAGVVSENGNGVGSDTDMATGMASVNSPGDITGAHPYPPVAIADLRSHMNALGAITGKPCNSTEQSTSTITSDAGGQYVYDLLQLNYKALAMFVTYYRGPATDARGMLDFANGSWSVKSAAYNKVVALQVAAAAAAAAAGGVSVS